jgi:hypothetical protein
MSRIVTTVPAKLAKKALQLTDEDINEVVQDGKVEIVHGYDRQTAQFFCDLMPRCEKGIFYGTIGTGKQLNKGQYFNAMMTLRLYTAADCVALDVPY